MQMKIRRAHKGQGVILGLGMLIIALLTSAICIDVGFYYTSQNTLQSAADAASLAAARELYASTAVSAATRQTNARNLAVQYAGNFQLDGKALAFDNPSQDIQFGYVDPTTKKYNASTFGTASTDPAYTATGGFNAVRVIVKKMTGTTNGPLPSIMGRLFGVNTMNTQAVSVAMLDDTVNAVSDGLRPIYGCLEQYQAVEQMVKNNPGTSLENYMVSLYGPSFGVNGTEVSACPSKLNGDWGFADFTDSGPSSTGNKSLADMFTNGYSGTIKVPDPIFSTDPGASGPSNNVTTALQGLIDAQTQVLVPLLTQWNGQGSNVQAYVGGFTGFVFTGYKFNNKSYGTGCNMASGDCVTGHFVNITCAQGQGICQTSTNNIGGGAVNLRLVN